MTVTVTVLEVVVAVLAVEDVAVLEVVVIVMLDEVVVTECRKFTSKPLKWKHLLSLLEGVPLKSKSASRKWISNFVVEA